MKIAAVDHFEKRTTSWHYTLCKVQMNTRIHVDCLVQYSNISSALAREILQSCTKPSMYLQDCGNVAPCFVDTLNSHVWVQTGPNLKIYGIICVKQNIFQHCICLAGHHGPTLRNTLCKFVLTNTYFHMKLFQSGPSVYAFWASEPICSSSALVVLEISHWKHIDDIFLQTIGGPVNCTETMLTLDWIIVAVAKWNLGCDVLRIKMNQLS